MRHGRFRLPGRLIWDRVMGYRSICPTGSVDRAADHPSPDQERFEHTWRNLIGSSVCRIDIVQDSRRNGSFGRADADGRGDIRISREPVSHCAALSVATEGYRWQPQMRCIRRRIRPRRSWGRCARNRSLTWDDNGRTGFPW